MTSIHNIILFAVVTCGTVKSFEFDSGEANRIEITPIYDTIIFSDVADIINELDNMNPLEALINSASDSDENVEDLLTEYQHYLDKAHKQRLNYLEKTKTKNKVPLTRHDRFVKTKPGMNVKYDDGYYSNYYNPNKIAPVPMNSALDLFVPLSSRLKFYNKPELSTIRPNDDITAFDKRLIDLPSSLPKLRRDILNPNCFCKNGQYPCKQCFTYDSIPPSYAHNYKSLYTSDNKPQLQNSEYLLDDKTRDTNDNTLNIRIKVDIQMPKTMETGNKLFKNKSHEDDTTNSKETSLNSLNIPFPYFNFPIPMDVFGYKKPTKYSKHDSMPLHKITIHKKKKSRTSSNNKKHKKKLITIHNLNLDTPQPTKIHYNPEDAQNTTDSLHSEIKNVSYTNSTVTEKVEINTIFLANKTEAAPLLNETKAEESLFINVNLTGFENGTEDNHKTEQNSLETDFSKTTEKLIILRRKREIGAPSSTNTTTSDPLAVIPLKLVVDNNANTVVNTTDHACCNKSSNNALQHESLDIKVSSDKDTDMEILYWPNCSKSSNNSILPGKNITTIILERENNKGKLNFTKEMRNNRTRFLEKAIFGEVNWDDVDTVAPVFMSFVGKYITGSLTFCSQNVCHSMKCAEKTCVHRTCPPGDRWNQKGHCNGSNSTDSIASLESIMDLPSNIAFEIVDILQDKMLGKMYGKVTLCISTKCISFVVSKKSFLKSKCSNKELTKTGHCPNIKTLKNF